VTPQLDEYEEFESKLFKKALRKMRDQF